MEVKEALSDQDILDCWPTIVGLRPHLRQGEYLAFLRKLQGMGYHLMYVRDPEDKKVKSILGWREMWCLFSGKTLYVDDVATLAEGRGKGFAGALQAWVKTHAKENGYNTMSLDTGYTRHDAHRLYLKNGFNLNCHHMAMHLKDF